MNETILNQAVDLDAGPGLDEVLDAIPVGLLILDRLGQVCDLNQQAASLLGAGREMVLGRPLNEVLPTGYKDIIKALRSRRQVARVRRIRPCCSRRCRSRACRRRSRFRLRVVRVRRTLR